MIVIWGFFPGPSTILPVPSIVRFCPVFVQVQSLAAVAFPATLSACPEIFSLYIRARIMSFSLPSCCVVLLYISSASGFSDKQGVGGIPKSLRLYVAMPFSHRANPGQFLDFPASPPEQARVRQGFRSSRFCQAIVRLRTQGVIPPGASAPFPLVRKPENRGRAT